jgi:two-component system LytT family response regulator
MKKIRYIIVDDIGKSRQLLNTLIELQFPELEMVGEAATVKEALKLISDQNPDLVFLDVELKDETSFDLLQALPQIDFDIIFTTAHDKYAIQAIRFSAMDYLMKPIMVSELREAVKKVFEKKDKLDKGRQIDALVYNINYGNADKKLALPTINGLEFISISEVVRCEASGNYTNFILSDGQRLLISKTLLDFEKMLTPYYFFRVHQSHLVNLRMIRKLNKGESGMLLMNDGSEIEVARRKKSELLEVLKEFALMNV